MKQADIESAIAQYQPLSQRQLVWRGFKKHRVAVFGLIVLSAFYLIALFCNFFAPHDPLARLDVPNAPPTRIRLLTAGKGLQRPFIYGYNKRRNPETLKLEYVENPMQQYSIRLFHRGYEYRLFGLIKADIHLFGVDEPGRIFLFGSDALGRDLFRA